MLESIKLANKSASHALKIADKDRELQRYRHEAVCDSLGVFCGWEDFGPSIFRVKARRRWRESEANYRFACIRSSLVRDIARATQTLLDMDKLISDKDIARRWEHLRPALVESCRQRGIDVPAWLEAA